MSTKSLRCGITWRWAEPRSYDGYYRRVRFFELTQYGRDWFLLRRSPRLVARKDGLRFPSWDQAEAAACKILQRLKRAKSGTRKQSTLFDR